MPCQIESLAPAPPRFKKFGSKATPRPRKVFARETEPSELLLHCTVPHTETLSCPQVLLASPATNPWRRSRPESDDLLYLGEPCQKGAVPLHSGRGTLKNRVSKNLDPRRSVELLSRRPMLGKSRRSGGAVMRERHIRLPRPRQARAPSCRRSSCEGPHGNRCDRTSETKQ